MIKVNDVYEPGMMFAKLDVVDMFTNIPIHKLFNLLREMLKEKPCEVLKNNHLMYMI